MSIAVAPARQPITLSNPRLAEGRLLLRPEVQLIDADGLADRQSAHEDGSHALPACCWHDQQVRPMA